MTPLPVLLSLRQFAILRIEQCFDERLILAKEEQPWACDHRTDPTTCSDAADLIEPLEGTCEQQFEHETEGLVC